jgi:hypothetical protein
MAGTRRDLLPECAESGTALDTFQEQWCARCFNLDCTRSIGGKSRFEVRVSNWEDRLFNNPSRMTPDDPRFPQITAQKFITIDVGRTPEIRSAWNDPRDLVEPAALSPIPAPPAPLAMQAPATKNDVPTSPEDRTASPQKNTASTRSTATAARLALGNAPDQSGKTLPSPPSASIPKRDPWTTPLPSDTTEQIVSPGTTVQFRKSS